MNSDQVWTILFGVMVLVIATVPMWESVVENFLNKRDLRKLRKEWHQLNIGPRSTNETKILSPQHVDEEIAGYVSRVEAAEIQRQWSSGKISVNEARKMLTGLEER